MTIGRPFLFLSGEFRVTMPIVFSNERWSHTMTSKLLTLNSDGTCHRNNTNEALQGVIFYASVENEKIRRDNLKFLIDNDIPCWPNPRKLLLLDDRHRVMEACADAGLTTDTVVFATSLSSDEIPLEYPYVMKMGNLHSGEGKVLVRSREDVPPSWDRVATCEPFYKGTSARVLFIGDYYFGIRYENPNSWIKNSSGAEVSLWNDIPYACVQHALKVKEHFGLEVCGIDYVIEDSGTFHFLEYNHFPGVDVDDSVTPVVRQFFEEKMRYVEEKARAWYTTDV